MKGEACGHLCVLKVDGAEIWTVTICDQRQPELLGRFGALSDAMTFAAAERERRFGGDGEGCEIRVPEDCPCRGIGKTGTVAVGGQWKEM